MLSPFVCLFFRPTSLPLSRERRCGDRRLLRLVGPRSYCTLIRTSIGRVARKANDQEQGGWPWPG